MAAKRGKKKAAAKPPKRQHAGDDPVIKGGDDPVIKGDNPDPLGPKKIKRGTKKRKTRG